MAKIYLDANVFIDFIARNRVEATTILQGHHVFVSPLSLSIAFYILRKEISLKQLEEFSRYMELVSLTGEISELALQGPTSGYEDNVQLHSAVKADTDIFYTKDRELLNLKFFGKIRLLSPLNL